MIKIDITKDLIVINGHADYDDFGKDIVCASVSSIAITTVNAILRIDSKAITYEESDGNLEIKVINHSKVVDELVDNMIDLLKELSKKYKNNIKIN